ncbi:MAG: AI-2E family transporter [Gemmatimonadota bacterium]
MTRDALLMASLVVLIAGARVAAPIIVPILVAGVLSIICATPTSWLTSHKVPAPLAVAVVMVGLLAISFLALALIGTSLAELSNDLPVYQATVRDRTREVAAWLGGRGIEVSDQVLQDLFNPSRMLRVVGTLASGLGGLLGSIVLVLLTTVFMLLEMSEFPAKALAARRPERTLAEMHRVTDNVKRYMALKTLISLVTGVSVSIWLTVVGVRYVLLWGALAFLLNYVPNIGSIIAAIPAILLAYLQLGLGGAIATAVGYLVINMVIGNFIEPRLFGREVGLSTLVVFLSLVFWGWVLGPVGMLLSVPLTMIVKIGLEASEQTRWIAVLLGNKVAAEETISV